MTYKEYESICEKLSKLLFRELPESMTIEEIRIIRHKVVSVIDKHFKKLNKE